MTSVCPPVTRHRASPSVPVFSSCPRARAPTLSPPSPPCSPTRPSPPAVGHQPSLVRPAPSRLAQPPPRSPSNSSYRQTSSVQPTSDRPPTPRASPSVPSSVLRTQSTPSSHFSSSVRTEQSVGGGRPGRDERTSGSSDCRLQTADCRPGILIVYIQSLHLPSSASTANTTHSFILTCQTFGLSKRNKTSNSQVSIDHIVLLKDFDDFYVLNTIQ